MSLHILGGKLRGHSLKAPKSRTTRPTTSLLRKALFDIAHNSIIDALFLDVCAGSGAVGIEALSRGAKQVTFIDQNKESVRCIHTNLEHLKLAASATVLRGEALTVLKRLEKGNQAFHIVYCDPPYHQLYLYKQLLSFWDQTSLLARGGQLFIESQYPSPFAQEKRENAHQPHKKEPLELSIQLKHLMFLGQRRFGDSLLHEFRKT